MNDVLLAIGPFIFYATAPSFNKLTATSQGRWVDQDRLSRAPASQFVGAGLDEVELEGIHYPERFGNPTLISDMAAASNGPNIYEIISINAGDLSGDPLGQWTIRSVSDGRSWFGANGPKKIEFTIKVKAYGSDNDGFSGSLF